MSEIRHFGLVANSTARTNDGVDVGYAFCGESNELESEYDCSDYIDQDKALTFFNSSCYG